MKRPDCPDFKEYIDAEDVAMTMYSQVPRDKAWILLPLEQRLEWIAMAEAACHLAFEAGYVEATQQHLGEYAGG